MLLKYLCFAVLAVIGLSGGKVVAAPQQQPPQFKHITELPAGIAHCAESDVQFNECMRNGVQSVIRRLKTGVPEINMPVLDPMPIDRANFQFSNNALNGKLSLKNMQVYGLSAIDLHSIDYQRNGNRLQMIIDGSMPLLFVKGLHKANVEFNNAKISSKGSFNISLTDVKFNAKMESELYENNGHLLMRAVKVEMNPTVGNMKLAADGIFDEPALNDAIVDLINQNWRQFYKSLVTESQQSWEPHVLKVINEFCYYLPFDLLVTLSQ